MHGAWDMLMDSQLCSLCSSPCISCGLAQNHSLSPAQVSAGPRMVCGALEHDWEHDFMLHKSRVSSGWAQLSEGCLLCRSSSAVACHAGPHISALRSVSGLVAVPVSKRRFIEKTILFDSIKHLRISPPSAMGAIWFWMIHTFGKKTSCSWHFMNRNGGCVHQLFSAGNYSFRSPFHCRSMGAGVSRAESLGGWSCSVAYRMWRNGWDGGEEKSCCTLMFPMPKALHRLPTLHAAVWHRGCARGLLLLAQPHVSSCARDWRCRASPWPFSLPSPHPTASVALGATGDLPLALQPLQQGGPFCCPSRSLGGAKERPAAPGPWLAWGPHGYLGTWHEGRAVTWAPGVRAVRLPRHLEPMALGVREGGKKPNQVKFWKIPLKQCLL